MRRRAALLAFASVALAGAAAAALAVREPPGLSPGPLACEECAVLALGFPVDPRRQFTYGLLLLRNEGGEPAVLDAVAPLELTPGMRVAGAYVVRTEDNPWNVTADDHEHFPPPNIADVVRPLRGYAVAPARRKTDTVEVILGLEVARAGTYGFRGLAVDYHVGETAYRATFQHRLRVCAPARLHEGDCNAPS